MLITVLVYSNIKKLFSFYAKVFEIDSLFRFNIMAFNLLISGPIKIRVSRAKVGVCIVVANGLKRERP